MLEHLSRVHELVVATICWVYTYALQVFGQLGLIRSFMVSRCVWEFVLWSRGR
jgi:hypothetical protein